MAKTNDSLSHHKKQQRLEQILVAPIVSYPRKWPLSADILLEVLMFFNIASLFHLSSTNRRFYNISMTTPALALFYSKPARFVRNLHINTDGFCVNDQHIQMVYHYNSGHRKWRPVPSPMYPIPFDQIISFRNIIVKLPFNYDQPINSPTMAMLVGVNKPKCLSSTVTENVQSDYF